MRYFRSGKISSNKEQITREEMIEDVKRIHPNAAENIVSQMEKTKEVFELKKCLYSVSD